MSKSAEASLADYCRVIADSVLDDICEIEVVFENLKYDEGVDEKNFFTPRL